MQFIDHIDSCLMELGVNPNHLEREITESLLIEDIDHTIERMNTLRQRGLRFAWDDFGTGYASLSDLKLLPLNKLKIDQSFVHDVLTDVNDEAIVCTIIALGQSLDLAVIAEGGKPQSRQLYWKNLVAMFIKAIILVNLLRWTNGKRLSPKSVCHT